MLGKLLKYEIPALGRKLVPLYIGWAATAILLGVSIAHVKSKSEFIMVFSSLLYTAAATAVVVMAIILIIQRYKNSLLGDEGYFYHVLPVTASQHIAAKSISALVWVLLSGAALVVTGILIGVFSGSFDQNYGIGDFLGDIFMIDGKAWVALLEFFIMLTMSITKSILAVYAALTIGHQARTHTGLASIGAYFGVLVFETMVGRAAMPLLALLSPNGFTPHSFGDLQLLFPVASVITVILGAIYFFICKYLMENRLDLA